MYNFTPNNSKTKPVNKNGFPKPKKVKCFKCKGLFSIKFVPSQKDYSKKK
jgi:hypothetical protein